MIDHNAFALKKVSLAGYDEQGGTISFAVAELSLPLILKTNCRDCRKEATGGTSHPQDIHHPHPPSPIPMGTKMKGLLKGLRYISQIFGVPTFSIDLSIYCFISFIFLVAFVM